MIEFDEPVVGFRIWYAAEPVGYWSNFLAESCDGDVVPTRRRLYNGWLRSVGSGCCGWGSGTVEALCHGLPHEAPALDCSCGLYAYDRLETAKLYENGFDARSNGVLVMGAVLLWGRVAYAQVVDRFERKLRGVDLGLRLRAQYGKVLALRDDGELTDQACRLRRIPAVSERYLEAVAREHGRQVRLPAPSRSNRDLRTGGCGAAFRARDGPHSLLWRINLSVEAERVRTHIRGVSTCPIPNTSAISSRGSRMR